MAQFVKPKKKRLKKKLRKKESDESEAAVMAAEIAALEVAAVSAGVGDHGSRAGRGAEKAQLEAQQRLSDLQKRQERCTAYHRNRNNFTCCWLQWVLNLYNHFALQSSINLQEYDFQSFIKPSSENHIPLHNTKLCLTVLL